MPPRQFKSLGPLIKQSLNEIKRICSDNCDVILVGDFNVPGTKWIPSLGSSYIPSSKSMNGIHFFQLLIDENEFVQHIGAPSRGEACLDLAFSTLALTVGAVHNEEEKAISIKSDHTGVSLINHDKSLKKRKVKRECSFYKFKKNRQ